jgi:hypothetical protein
MARSSTASVSYPLRTIPIFEKPTPWQRKAGIFAVFSILLPIAAYLIGQVWIATAMETDPVPQGTMVWAYLLSASVTFFAVPTLLFSVVVIIVEEMAKRKRR